MIETTTKIRRRSGRALLLALGLLCCRAVSAEYTLLDRVVAIVEDEVILASEVRARLQLAERNLRQRGKPAATTEQLYPQVLERLILESLQLQRANKIGLRIGDQELNQTMTRLAEKNGLSLNDFKHSVEQQGDNYRAVREQVRRDLLMRQVQQRSVLRSIDISDSEIENFLRSERGSQLLSPELNIEHILLPLAAEAGPAAHRSAREQLNQLRQKALSQSHFAALEKEIADAGAEHNQLGWRRAEQLPTLFAELASHLKKGEVSEILRNDSGYHLIALRGVRGGIDGTSSETQVRHILIGENAIRSSQAAEQLAVSIRTELAAGGDFAALARQHSDDPGSALSGGDLGWTTPGMLVPAFQQAMDATAVGEISTAFESRFGWHILEVLARRDKDISAARAAEQARMRIAESKYDDALNNWLQELRDNAFVEIK